MKALADREIAREISDASSPDPYDPHLRTHGSESRLGRRLIEVAAVFSRGADVTEFADFVSLVVLRGRFESLDRQQVRAGLLAQFRDGPKDR